MHSTDQPLRAWFIVAMLFVLMAINFLDKVVLGLVAIPLMKELHLSAAQYGELAGSFFFLFGITGVVGGFMTNRIGTRWLLLGMSILWAVAQLPIAYGSSLGVLFTCRLLLGAGEGPMQPIAIHACYKWFPDKRRNLPVSIFQQGGVLGTLLAGMLIPQINDRWGWHFNFLVLAALGIVWAVVWLCIGREGRQEAVPAPVKDVAPSRAGQPARYRDIFADRTVAYTIALHFASFLTLSLALTWLPTYLQRGLGFEAHTAGHIFAACILVCAPVGLLLSMWSQRLLVRGVSSHVARGRFICICLGVAGLLLVAVGTLPLGSITKIIFIALAIAAAPVISSLGPAMLAEIVHPTQRGAVLGVEYSVAWIAGIVAPPMVGWMAGANNAGIATGFEHGLLITGAVLVVLTLRGLGVLNPERSARNIAGRAAA